MDEKWGDTVSRYILSIYYFPFPVIIFYEYLQLPWKFKYFFIYLRLHRRCNICHIWQTWFPDLNEEKDKIQRSVFEYHLLLFKDCATCNVMILNVMMMLEYDGN